MKITTIPAFGWGVQDSAWEGGAAPDENGEWPDLAEGEEPPKVTQRTLYITIFTQAVAIPPTGAQLQLPVEQIALPFGIDQGTGRAAFEKLAAAMMGEAPPPDVQVARDMPPMSPAAAAILAGARPPRR